jgi:hypothetical protein
MGDAPERADEIDPRKAPSRQFGEQEQKMVSQRATEGVEGRWREG